jgi:hypothetical protein
MVQISLTLMNENKYAILTNQNQMSKLLHVVFPKDLILVHNSF